MTARRLRWRGVAASELLDSAPLRERWDALNADGSNLPILASYAVAAALRAFGRGNERLLVASEGDEPIAMVLLQRSGAGQWHTFQPSQLPLGAWVARPALSPLALARQLVQGPLGASLVVSFTQVDPRFAPPESDGPSWSFADYIETGWVEVQGTLEDYWAGRGKNLRSNLRKQRNKLAADGVEPRLTELSAPGAMRDALARYGRMESTGWKATEGTAIHPDNAQGRFYRALFEQAAACNEARVYELHFGDRIVASNLCVQRGDTLVVLKTAYDEGVGKSLSPAVLLTEALVQRAFETAAWRRIEFYGRFLEWHSRWTEHKRTLYHLSVYRWPWLKTLRDLRQRSVTREPETAA